MRTVSYISDVACGGSGGGRGMQEGVKREREGGRRGRKITEVNCPLSYITEIQSQMTKAPLLGSGRIKKF